MNRYYSYLNSAKEIISTYKGAEPLSAYLKTFFSANKKYGSKDRKAIAHLCYCYFRLGKLTMQMTTDEAIVAGLFLCTDSSNDILSFLEPQWNELAGLPVVDKLTKVNPGYDIGNIFPWKDQLGNEVDYSGFCKSFLVQPDLFLRIRPGHKEAVEKKLSNASISYSVNNDTCISLSNTLKVDDVIELDKEAVVQDMSSQKVGELMQSAMRNLPKSITVWDCCAASGGKSIMCHDLNGHIQLTVSDIRESILVNLKKRFLKAGIRDYKSFIANLSQPDKRGADRYYDFIIADVPCSGSGTWSRTPEQIYFFQETEIERYSLLQQRIMSNVADYLKPGGFLLYITCSVFRKENENIVEWITDRKQLELKAMKLFTGYEQKADTLFGALLYRPL